MPSILDVARHAGVSPGTVSNVLGGRRARPESVARVRAAVEALGYQPDRAASQLRSGRARIVAVVVPSLENPFFASIIAAVEQALRPEGYDVIIACSDDDEEVENKRLAAILSWKPAGVIAIPSADSFRSHALIEASGIPYVIVDRLVPELRTDTICVDNRHAGALAAEHLLGLGHERVLLVATTLRLANIRERCAGVEDVLRARALLMPQVLEAGLSFAQASEQMGRWLERSGAPTAVIALTNFSTMAALSCLGREGLAVPEDVSLVGFDDYAWMSATTPSITAVRQPIERLGQTAWSRLRERIAGDADPGTRALLPCTLQVRASTRSPRLPGHRTTGHRTTGHRAAGRRAAGRGRLRAM